MKGNVASAIAIVLAGCARQVIQVIPDGTTGGTSAAPADPTFEIVTRVAGARDPLPVGNSSVAYADLERSLGLAVGHAVPARHDSVLTVELIAADADFHSPRLAVSMVARATLRTRVGNTFIAQT